VYGRGNTVEASGKGGDVGMRLVGRACSSKREIAGGGNPPAGGEEELRRGGHFGGKYKGVTGYKIAEKKNFNNSEGEGGKRVAAQVLKLVDYFNEGGREERGERC